MNFNKNYYFSFLILGPHQSAYFQFCAQRLCLVCVGPCVMPTFTGIGQMQGKYFNPCTHLWLLKAFRTVSNSGTKEIAQRLDTCFECAIS